MIIDSLQNASFYDSLNPRFAKVFDYIKSLDFSSLQPGKTILEEDALIVMINDTKLKPQEDSKLEVHNKYIDIHIPVSTDESFGWQDRKELKSPQAPFDDEGDGQLFDDVPKTYYSIAPGNFTIFFPHDGHAPCVGTGPILKIIAKVKA